MRVAVAAVVIATFVLLMLLLLLAIVRCQSMNRSSIHHVTSTLSFSPLASWVSNLTLCQTVLPQGGDRCPQDDEPPKTEGSLRETELTCRTRAPCARVAFGQGCIWLGLHLARVAFGQLVHFIQQLGQQLLRKDPFKRLTVGL